MNEFGGNRVLVVEPDSWTRVLLTEFLNTAGFIVHGTSDTESALDFAKSFDPHVLVSNYQLADGSSGADLALTLRQINSALGLVFLSKLSEQDFGLLPSVDSLTGAQYFSAGDGFSSEGLLGALSRALPGV